MTFKRYIDESIIDEPEQEEEDIPVKVVDIFGTGTCRKFRIGDSKKTKNAVVMICWIEHTQEFALQANSTISLQILLDVYSEKELIFAFNKIAKSYKLRSKYKWFTTERYGNQINRFLDTLNKRLK